MKILVTGATGFIGSHLVEKLVKEGHKIKALVKEEEKKDQRRRETINILKNLNIQIVWGDLLDLASLKKAVEKVEVVFHLAAIARPMNIPNHLYFKVNEGGTKNLLDACKTNRKIKKIIIMSSISAVGPAKKGVAIKENFPCKPIDTYGKSKLAQEKIAEKYIKDYNLPIIFLRPPMVFGPRDLEMLRLFKVINRRFFPLSSKVKGLEFLYVENLVEACILCLKKGKEGEKYHVSNGEHYSINELKKSIQKSFNKKVIPLTFPLFMFRFGGYLMELLGRILKFHPPFKHDTVDWMTKKFWYNDISKIKKLGFIQKVSLDEGIKRTTYYYKEKRLIRN